MRPGFSVVELLVAIVILAVGVLALAATAGLVAAHSGDGARLTEAAHAARSAIDSLASEPCSTIVSASATLRGGTVQWSVQRDSLGANIDVIVRAGLRHRAQQHEYRVLVPCPGD